MLSVPCELSLLDDDELDESLFFELELELLLLELESELDFLFDELELALLLLELKFEELLLLLELELALELELFAPRLILTGPEPALDAEFELVSLLELVGAELRLLALDDDVLCFELPAVGVLERVLSAEELGVCELIEPSLKALDWETAGCEFVLPGAFAPCSLWITSADFETCDLPVST